MFASSTFYFLVTFFCCLFMKAVNQRVIFSAFRRARRLSVVLLILSWSWESRPNAPDVSFLVVVVVVGRSKQYEQTQLMFGDEKGDK